MFQSLPAFLLCACMCIGLPAVAFAQAPATQPSAEPSYEEVISKRAADVVKALNLSDQEKAARVHELVTSQYRNLNAIDTAAGEETKSAGEDKARITEIKTATDARKKELHQSYLSALANELSPQQIDIVKDKMTYNVLHVTYKAYCDMIPSLTEDQKAFIMQQLVEARELAMDGGSSKEKHAIFGKYKGRINIYLSKAGYNMKDEEKAWRERIKAERGAATQPGR